MLKVETSADAVALAKRNGTVERIKSRLVEELIGRRYTVGEQISLLRQRDEKPTEYEAFYAFAEECKARVRAYLDDCTASVTV